MKWRYHRHYASVQAGDQAQSSSGMQSESNGISPMALGEKNLMTINKVLQES